ncbi:hypothetical protein Dxin01_01362 [Deinococcus xinjiangensis]|uniref:DUF2382 domain-containing protein n=1 Tax=Deinococcus xinjiangensis TaxID=457454 RepID=A0ABP9VAA3_9DEIO
MNDDALDHALPAADEGHVTGIRRRAEGLSLPENQPSSSLSKASARTELERLTLHEERAKVEVLREQVGSVSVRKVVRERREVLPVTLTTEILEISVTDGAGKVLLNGEALEAGRTYEVIIRDERARVEKQVFALSDVTLSKQANTVTHTEEVTLRREELEVRDPNGLVREVVGDES